MTHLYIKLCDLCGKPCEMNGMEHAGSITADVFIKNFNTFRENFDVCNTCLKETGLDQILLKMKQQKEDNNNRSKNAQKVLKIEQKYLSKQS